MQNNKPNVTMFIHSLYKNTIFKKYFLIFLHLQGDNIRSIQYGIVVRTSSNCSKYIRDLQSTKIYYVNIVL